LDYFNNIFTNFWVNNIEAYGGVRELSDLMKNILLCVPEMNESLTGLEQREGEY